MPLFACCFHSSRFRESASSEPPEPSVFTRSLAHPSPPSTPADFAVRPTLPSYSSARPSVCARRTLDSPGSRLVSSTSRRARSHRAFADDPSRRSGEEEDWLQGAGERCMCQAVQDAVRRADAVGDHDLVSRPSPPAGPSAVAMIRRTDWMEMDATNGKHVGRVWHPLSQLCRVPSESIPTTLARHDPRTLSF